MAAPAPAPPAPRRRHRLLAALALLALLLGAGFWLLGRESTLRALAQRVADASGGQIVLAEVSGSLYGSMRIGQLRYRDAQRLVTAERIEIAWSPLQYFTRGVAIERLRVAALAIDSIGPPQAPLLPASLAPPFQLSIAQARLERLTLRDADGSHELRELRFKLAGDGAGWRLQEAGALTPWGRLTADGTLGARRPFALDARASLTPAAAGPARLGAELRGNLSLLELRLSGSAPYASGDAALTLAPFDALPLRALRVSGREIDPARFDPAWPAARLSLEASASVGADRQLSGRLTLHNQDQPGPLDRRRLPLREASARLGGTPERASLDAILLDLGAAGAVRGAGRIERGERQAARAEFTLRTAGIDLKALHGRLKTTRIAGDIKLASAAGAHTLSALLAEDGLRLAVQASLKEQLLRLDEARLQAGKGSLRVSGQASLGDAQAFQASASARHFNPADFGAYPAADLNAELRLAGHLTPDWLAQADFTLQPSRLFGQPLSGAGRLTADARHLGALQAKLALGRNTAELSGNFGLPGESVAWRVEAPQLAALPGALSGALSASGVLRGSAQAPRSSFTADARGLGLGAAARRADSLLHVSGEAALGGARRQLEIDALTASARRFSPDAFGPYPAGAINAELKGSARLGADWRLALELALQDSALGGAPLAGHARVTAAPGQIEQAELDLRLGPNRLQAHGGFGAARARLDWQLDAPRLASLGPQFGGALRGAGALSGSAAAPALSLALDGADLRLGEHRARRAHASASLGMAGGADQPLHSDLELDGYSGPGLTLAGARLQTRGSGAAHTLQLAARNDSFDLQAQASGGLNGGVWSGTLERLQNRGRFALALQAPAPLRLASAAGAGPAGLLHPEQVALGNAVLKLADGAITLRNLDKDGARWRGAGQASGVPLAWLAQWSPSWRDNAGGDLTLGAQWSFDLQAGRAEPALAGMLHVYRERGDLTLGADTPLALGLRTLDARAEVASGALRLQLAFDGARAGQARLDGSVQLAHGRIANDSALSLTGSANMGSLAWLAPLTGLPGLELDGALRATLSGAGSVGAPLLKGDIGGDQLALNWAEQGVKLRNGQLRARFDGDQLQLQQLSFDGIEGQARAAGWLRWADAEASMHLTLTAERLLALARPDRTLVISGGGALLRDQKRFRFEGKFKAERAQIELAAQNTPTLSDDVVVLGRAGARAAAPALPLAIDLEAELGEAFYLKGKGLDAQLAGSVRLRVPERGAPRASGAIHVVSGTYDAYGQKLRIERGLLNFTGAYDNPGLNLLAVRKRPEGEALSETNVEAGVEVRGTALAPSAKLVSTPTVPDSEKLAWLVLGHGSEGTAGRELGLLSTAAGALFGASGGGSLQARLASSLGLDELALSQAKGLESTVLTVGKRLSQRAYLSFEQGASTASSLVRLRYKLNPRITLQFQTGTNSALDVLYTWAFD